MLITFSSLLSRRDFASATSDPRITKVATLRPNICVSYKKQEYRSNAQKQHIYMFYISSQLAEYKGIRSNFFMQKVIYNTTWKFFMETFKPASASKRIDKVRFARRKGLVYNSSTWNLSRRSQGQVCSLWRIINTRGVCTRRLTYYFTKCGGNLCHRSYRLGWLPIW